MSENANPNAFAGDLLSGLAANPELLKNAMQMASALASSGMLNGLFSSTPTGESPSPAAAPPTTPPPSRSTNATAGGFADLLAGLMGQTNPTAAESAEKDSKTTSTPLFEEKKTDSRVLAGQEREQRHAPSPSHNDRIHLLQSICPFLPDDKREKVQFLIKLMGLLSAAEQMGLGKLF